jgi:RNA polymerase sigma factor (sigma-70 family)
LVAVSEEVQPVIDGESSRFTRLYKELYPRVLAYAMRRAAPDVAREATDETFLVAWRRRDAIPAEAALPWLLVVARNILSDQHRRGRRQDALALEIARAAAMSEPGLETAVVERIAVLSALAQLSSKDREVLILTVWDGLSNRDAAAVLGCSAATFAVRLYRARRRLADALEQFDAQPRDTASHGPPSSRRVADTHPKLRVDHQPVTASKEEQR